MRNEFHIFDNFYNDLSKDQQDFILNLNKIYKSNNKILEQQVKNMAKEIETEKNTVKNINTDNDFNNLTGNMIEAIKPFDITIAVANAKAKQEQDNIVTLYTNKLILYINNIIKKISIDGYRFCIVNIYDVLDKKFDELDTDKQTEIIGNVANKFRKGGYSIFVSLSSENGIMEKRTIRVSW